MKRINIMGLGIGWHLCPEDGETWTVNLGCLFRKTDMMFYMDRALYKDTDPQNEDEVSLLEKRISCQIGSIEHIEESVMRVSREEQIPIVTTRPFSDIANNIVFPLEEIVEEYGSDCFGNSADYMTAYALYKGYNDIHYYGVNLGDDFKSKYEKSPMSFWVGVAMGLGCRVSIHGSMSKLLRTESGELYGYGKPQWIQRDKGMQRRM